MVEKICGLLQKKMKPLFVLTGTFIISVLVLEITGHGLESAMSGRIAMTVMLVFTAVSHFALTKGMVMMMPSFIPFKKTLVYFTGIFEIAAAIGIQISGIRVLTAWLLIFFFILLLPANINAAIRKVDFQKANYDGPGIRYLWFRVPLQILFILWTYFSAIRF